jgi:hypothetical protein
LGRRWVICDFAKPACMIARKRLIDQNAKPFLDPNYDRQAFTSKWQDYRENYKNFQIKRTAKIIVPKIKKRTKVCIKVVDVFGFESATVQEVE